jgi:hypothetical protein
MQSNNNNCNVQVVIDVKKTVIKKRQTFAHRSFQLLVSQFLTSRVDSNYRQRFCRPSPILSATRLYTQPYLLGCGVVLK